MDKNIDSQPPASNKRAAIYRQGKPPELLTAPDLLSGENVLSDSYSMLYFCGVS